MIIRLPIALALAFLLAWKLGVLRGAGVRVAAWLESRWAPLALFAIAAIVFTLAWGSWTAIPVIHDEASYLFQAKLFASGRWTAPPPPIPEFFEQWHVFVVPHYASKYPPGHALLLAPGVLLGLPGMMPVLLGAATGALVFSIARRLSNGVIAFWTWGWWVTTPMVLWLFGSYFSQSTSAFCWMLGWYALLRWRDDEPARRDRWLFVVAASVAWLGLTRPLTALAYALPIGVYVLWKVAQRREWRTLGLAMALGVAMLAMIPLWSIKTVDSARTTPYGLYSKMYFPWDAPGFGLDSSPPMRALPPDMAAMTGAGLDPRHAYHASALPRTMAERTYYVIKDMVGPPRVILTVFAVIGLFALTAELAFGLAAAVVLLVCYLWFNHGSTWTVYYVEIQPVLAMVVALGLWRVMHLRLPADPRGRTRAVAPFVAAVSLLMTLFLAEFTRVIVTQAHAVAAAAQRYQRTFLASVDQVPAKRSIIFVRYSPRHDPHLSLIFNDPDLAGAPHWFVYDRGADNARLLRAAPDRVPFLYDEESGVLQSYLPPGNGTAAR
jgi:hypothetical protein